MIVPFAKDDQLLRDIHEMRDSADDADQLHVWWLGQSGFLIQWHGRHLLFDPYLSDSLTRKYAETDKPHVRMTERVIDPARLDFVDVVTSSHNHTDHLDAETLNPLLAANPNSTMVVPAANWQFAAERLQVELERLTPVDAGGSVKGGVIRLDAIPAAHNEIDRDERGRCKYLGYIARLGPWAIYHSGDTLLYDGLKNRLRPYQIDLAILPINGNEPQRRVAGNLSGPEAAQLAHDIGAGCVIPCHYDMFEFNTVTPDEFVAAAEKLGQSHAVLQNGQRHTLHKPA